jgi:hypothetical protein
MNPEGESIKKPDDEDEDGSKDIDTEDIDSDKTEGDELKQKARSLAVNDSSRTRPALGRSPRPHPSQ